MVYDAATQQMVLYGGYGPSSPLGDTWIFGATAPPPPAVPEAASLPLLLGIGVLGVATAERRRRSRRVDRVSRQSLMALRAAME
jgi:hypothetical protein